MLLAMVESVAQIVGGMAPLFDKWTGLSVVQHVSKMFVPSFDVPAIGLAVLEVPINLGVGPLVTNENR